jgi:hypothetical protein
MWHIVTHFPSHFSECRSCHDHALGCSVCYTISSTASFKSRRSDLLGQLQVNLWLCSARQRKSLKHIETNWNLFSHVFTCFPNLQWLSDTLCACRVAALTSHVSVVVPRPCLSLSRQCLKRDETGWNMMKPIETNWNQHKKSIEIINSYCINSPVLPY